MNSNGKSLKLSAFQKYTLIVGSMLTWEIYAFDRLIKLNISSFGRFVSAEILIVVAALYIFIMDRIIS